MSYRTIGNRQAHVISCNILENITFSYRYQWGANNAGTHFWHAHSGLQKMDGVFGSIIVRQPPELDPHHHLYDFDLSNHVLALNDWMHEQLVEHFPGKRLSDVGQTPDSILINGKGRYTVGDCNVLGCYLLEIARRLKSEMQTFFQPYEDDTILSILLSISLIKSRLEIALIKEKSTISSFCLLCTNCIVIIFFQLYSFLSLLIMIRFYI